MTRDMNRQLARALCIAEGDFSSNEADNNRLLQAAIREGFVYRDEPVNDRGIGAILSPGPKVTNYTNDKERLEAIRVSIWNFLDPLCPICGRSQRNAKHNRAQCKALGWVAERMIELDPKRNNAPWALNEIEALFNEARLKCSFSLADSLEVRDILRYYYQVELKGKAKVL